jgi:hypothetical protein
MSELTLDGLLENLSAPMAGDDLEKAASDTTEPSVADQLKNTLTKEASDASQTIGENDMSVVTGNSIADSILAMLDGGMDKEAGVHGDGGGNKVKTDLDTMEQQHADRIMQTPRQGKSVTQVAKELQTRAPAGAGADSVKEENEAATEGNAGSVVSAIPSDIEKSAAVDELVGEGIAWADAVAMVKEACDHLEAQEYELEKAAAVNALVGEGMTFDEALEKVAEFEAMEFEEEYSDLEKSAAVSTLMDEDGVSFDEAVEMVRGATEGLGK